MPPSFPKVALLRTVAGELRELYSEVQGAAVIGRMRALDVGGGGGGDEAVSVRDVFGENLDSAMEQEEEEE